MGNETYNTLVALAADRGQSPQVLAAQLLQQQVDQEWESVCAKFDDLTATLEWQVMERETDEEYTASQPIYDALDRFWVEDPQAALTRHSTQDRIEAISR